MKELGELESGASQCARVLCCRRDNATPLTEHIEGLCRAVDAENKRRRPASLEGVENPERGWIINTEHSLDSGMSVQDDLGNFATSLAGVVAIQTVDHLDSGEVAEGAQEAADPIKIAGDPSASDDDDIAGAAEHSTQMPPNEFPSLDVVGSHEGIRAACTCVDRDHCDPCSANRSDAIGDAFRIHRVEDNGVHTQSRKLTELLELAIQLLI